MEFLIWVPYPVGRWNDVEVMLPNFPPIGVKVLSDVSGLQIAAHGKPAESRTLFRCSLAKSLIRSHTTGENERGLSSARGISDSFRDDKSTVI